MINSMKIINLGKGMEKNRVLIAYLLPLHLAQKAHSAFILPPRFSCVMHTIA